ncbi:MAG TPA: TlpA disulfide reductase family protein [Polyangiaceae bacterium]|nr:TlpA disulfide reductase family protein [Polyangiaceae bacterium]
MTACLCVGLGCDEDDQRPAPASDNLASRGQAVQAKPQLAAASASAKAPAATHGDSTPRTFCSSASPSSGKELPDQDLVQRSAGLSPLPERIPVGNGEWTWINLWAAWCVPCKQEIPLLREWEQKLSKGPQPLKVIFVSLDDDERQLSQFLKDQPTSGIKASYWLREGKERVEWLKSLRVDPDTQLPGHFLVDPKGAVRCFISGAVEPADFPRLQQILAD